jgi:hypothetical protein
VALEKRYAKNNEKSRQEFLQPDRAERMAASVTRTVERFESFYGRLDENQRRLVADAVAASPAEPGAWIAAREQRQREALEILRRIVDEKPDAARTQQMLRDLARRFDGSPQPATAAAQQRVVQHHCELIARLHNSTTPEQRRTARDKLRGWEGDARQLAGRRWWRAPRRAACRCCGRGSARPPRARSAELMLRPHAQRGPGQGP